VICTEDAVRWGTNGPRVERVGGNPVATVLAVGEMLRGDRAAHDIEALGAQKSLTASVAGETRSIRLCDSCATKKADQNGQVDLCAVCLKSVREMLAWRAYVETVEQMRGELERACGTPLATDAHRPIKPEHRVRVKGGGR